MNIKSKIIISLLSVVIIYLVSLQFTNDSVDSHSLRESSNVNISNAKMLHIGMGLDSTLQIMGSPRAVFTSKFKGSKYFSFWYYRIKTDGELDDIKLFFDSTLTIKRMSDLEMNEIAN